MHISYTLHAQLRCNTVHSRTLQLSVCHNYDSSSICARFELDSIREPCHNCDSIREWEILECLNRAQIESQLWQSSRIESSSNRNCDRRFDSSLIREWKKLNKFILFSNARIESNRAHIKRESSSNRNCDRRFTKNATTGAPLVRLTYLINTWAAERLHKYKVGSHTA